MESQTLYSVEGAEIDNHVVTASVDFPDPEDLDTRLALLLRMIFRNSEIFKLDWTEYSLITEVRLPGYQ